MPVIDLIARSGKVSPSFEPGEMDPDFAVPITPHHAPTHWYSRATLGEISLLSPGVAIPWYVGAKVTRTFEAKTRTRPSTPADEVVPGNGQLIRRYFANVPITVR